MRTKLAVLTAIALIAVCLAIRPAAAANRWGANYFPNTELITMDGKKVHFYDDLIKGKTVAITMIYTQCKDACPLETARMRQVQKALGDRVGKDIFFYSISIDPEHDTPEVLRDYAEMYNVGPGWTFLTGKKDEIDALSKKIGLYTPIEQRTRDGHNPTLLIGNEATGQWMRQSAGDNPKFLAQMIGEMLGDYRQEVIPAKTYSSMPHMDFEKGRYMFGKYCAACHSIGSGDKVGPDLQGVTNVRDPKWLKEFITAPDKKIDEEKDPIAIALYEKYKHIRMPNLYLISQDVDSIIGFLKKQDAAPQGQTKPESKSGEAKPAGANTAAAKQAQPMGAHN